MALIDIVFCVERGGLETQAIRLVRSLRQKDGEGEQTWRFVAYAPREKTKPSQETIDTLVNLGVDYCDSNLNIEFEDYPLANKPLVCSFHEQREDCAEFICFADSDTLFLRNFKFERYLPSPGQVVILPVDGKNIGVENLDQDKESAYWSEAYDLLEIRERRFVTTMVSKERILEYYNSGFFIVKKEDQLMQAWKATFLKLESSGIFPLKGKYFLEQSCLSMTITKMALKVSSFPGEINFPLSYYAKRWRGMAPYSLKKVAHVHYHKIDRHPKQWNRFVKKLGDFGNRVIE